MSISSAKRFSMTILAATAMTSQAYGAGFEKNIMWSGRHAGVGGTGVSFVEGGEAIYLNPAGLLSSRTGMDATANLSITSSKYEGPFQDNVISKSDDKITTPFGVTYGYTANEKWAVGAGVYASGGSAVKYEDVTVVPGLALTPDFETNLQLIEASIGGSYKVAEGLKIGAAWRAGFAKADFSTAQAVGSGLATTLAAVQFKDLEAEEFGGFKIGAQYSPSETWGVGVAFRSEFDLDLECKANAQINPVATPNTVTDLGEVNAKLGAKFPMQLIVGGHYHLVPNLWHLAADYSYVDYSTNSELKTTATFPVIGTLSNTPLHWEDQHTYRLGVEYLGMAMPVRFGVVHATAVTPKDHAKPTLSPPGSANSVTLGTGRGFMENKLMVNAAFEYSWIKGDASADATNAFAGDYSAIGYTLHTGVTYLF